MTDRDPADDDRAPRAGSAGARAGRALVVGDGWHHRNVLAAVRALHRAGWQVGVAAPGRGLAAASRAVARRHRLPSPTLDFPAFAAALPAIVRRGRYDIVFGAGDAEVLALTALGEAVGTCVPHAAGDRVRAALDKLELAAAARSVGLASPSTVPATAEAVAATPLPVVVKARLHWTPGSPPAPARLDAAILADRRAVRRRVAQIRAAGGEAVLQELVDGRPIAYVAIVDRDGEPVAEFQQVGDGTWPRAGVWTRVETAPLDEPFAARCRALLRRLGWFGLVQLQFIVPRDGVPRLIDFNGRFYASLALPIQAGLDVTSTWAALALGRPHDAPATLPAGIRYQWLEGDLRRALHERRGGLGRDLLDTLRRRRGSVHSVWRSDDPRPAAALVVERARALGWAAGSGLGSVLTTRRRPAASPDEPGATGRSGPG